MKAFFYEVKERIRLWVISYIEAMFINITVQNNSLVFQIKMVFLRFSLCVYKYSSLLLLQE